MKLKDKIVNKLDNRFGGRRWYDTVRKDYIIRTLVFSAIGTVFTVAFAVFNGVFGIIYGSVWYGAFAGYLFMLAVQRVLVIVIYRAVRKKYGGDEISLETKKTKIYLANGAVFIPITVALSVIIALLITSQKPTASSDVLAIATAAYAFGKIALAVFNFTKANRVKDPIARTVRNTGLVDAMISMILLENTLIAVFGTLTHDMFVLIAVSGLVVCVFALMLGTFMVVSAAKRLKSMPSAAQSTTDL